MIHRLLSSTEFDGDLELCMDGWSGPHAIGFRYAKSGLTGAVLQRIGPEKPLPAWTSHTCHRHPNRTTP